MTGKWTPEALAMLGKVSDETLGKRVGVGKSAVASRRRQAKIQPAHPEAVERNLWEIPENERLLGTMTDKDAARIFGVCTSSVRQARQRRGILAHNPPQYLWLDPANVALLGTMADMAIGRLLDVTTEAVWHARKIRGIPKYQSLEKSEQSHVSDRLSRVAQANEAISTRGGTSARGDAGNVASLGAGPELSDRETRRDRSTHGPGLRGPGLGNKGVDAVDDDVIAPLYCQHCGNLIPESRRGHGHPPKTCSEVCRKARAALIEKTRYEKVKNTSEWKATRADYLRRLKARIERDPEFSELFRARAILNSMSWAYRLQLEDPARYQQMLEHKRQERRTWREALIGNPGAYEAYKEKYRNWYRALSNDERDRIFNAPKRRSTPLQHSD